MRELYFKLKTKGAAAAHAQYRADIDGLRAVAVLAVLLCHARIGWSVGFRGGYIGVDIFFVISGYLITAQIIKDLEADRFSIISFLERRIRRILPALAVVAFITLNVSWFILFPEGFKELGGSLVAQALLVSNIYFWSESGYFAQGSEVMPLLHTWSLAVEEQFYLLFPLMLLLVKRFAGNFIGAAILLVGGLSFGLSVYSSYHYPTENFYFLPTRAWELLVGAYLAAIPAQVRASRLWPAELLSWGGVILILCPMFLFNSETRFPGAAASLPCAGTALIIWANGRSLTSVGKLLALRPLVFIGLVSYSLYLWHWPILVFANYVAINPLSLSQRLVLCLACFVLAVLTWQFVEVPFRGRKFLKKRAQVFSFAGSVIAAMFLAGLIVVRYQGFPQRIPTKALKFANAETEQGLFRHELTYKEAHRGEFIEIGTGDKGQAIDILIWGDSHAMAVMPVLDLLCKENSVRGVAATHSSMAPLVGFVSPRLETESIPINNAVIDFVARMRVNDVILIAKWNSYGELANLRRSLLYTLQLLRETNARIWIMRQVPTQRWNVPRVLGMVAWRGGDVSKYGLSISEYRKQSQYLDPLFEGLPHEFEWLSILFPSDILIADDLCRVVAGGKALYWDESHLTDSGAMLLRPLFEPIFQGIRKE